MIYMDAKLIQIAEKQAQIINELTRNLPLINLPSGVMESLRIQNKLAKQFIDSVPPYLRNFSQISKYFDEMQNIKNSFASCSETIRLISENLQKYDFSHFQNLEENRKFLDDIEHINPELYKEILKVYGDKPFHKLTQFINKCRSLPEDEQYNFICDQLGYKQNRLQQIEYEWNTVKSDGFKKDLADNLSAIDVTDNNAVNQVCKNVCLKHGIDAKHLIITVIVNKQDNPESYISKIFDDIVSWVINKFLDLLLWIIKFYLIFYVLQNFLGDLKPEIKTLLEQELPQQHQIETLQPFPKTKANRNSNTEIESLKLQQNPQNPKTKLPESDAQQPQK